MDLDTELDTGLEGMIGNASSDSGAAPDANAAQAALDAAEVPVVEIRMPSKPASSSASDSAPETMAGLKRKSKHELISDLTQRDAQIQQMSARLQVLESKDNGQAVQDLGAVIALAIKVSGQFVAANRGPHWLFSDDEAKANGDAWAVVAAPYADKLKEVVPWAIAIGVTWTSLKPRLEQDKILMAQTKDGKPKEAGATSD